MLIKKIVIDNMSKIGSYFAIGGLRFYLKDGSTYNTYGNGYITNTLTEGETDKIKITSTATYTSNNYYYVLNLVDTTKKIVGSYTDNCYWLNSSGATITITFPNSIDIATIYYTPKPASDRGLNAFNISFYDENDTLIETRTIDNSNIPPAYITLLAIDKQYTNSLSKIVSEDYIYSTLIFSPLIIYSDNNNTPLIFGANIGSQTTLPNLKCNYNADPYIDKNVFLPINNTYYFVKNNVVSTKTGSYNITFFVNIPSEAVKTQDKFYFIEGIDTATLNASNYSYALYYEYSSKTLYFYYYDGAGKTISGNIDIPLDTPVMLSINIINTKSIEIYVDNQVVITTNNVNNIYTSLYYWLYGANRGKTNTALFYMSSLFQFTKVLSDEELKKLKNFFKNNIVFVVNNDVYVYNKDTATFNKIKDISADNLSMDIIMNIGNRLPLEINKASLNTLGDYQIYTVNSGLTIKGVKYNQLTTTLQQVVLSNAKVINSIEVFGNNILIQFSEDGANYFYYKDGDFLQITDIYKEGNKPEDFTNLTSDDLQKFIKDMFIRVVLFDETSILEKININYTPKDTYTFTNNVNITEYCNSITIMFNETGDYLVVLI